MVNTQRGMNPLAAGLVGTIAGAVGATATIALTDEHTRRKMGKAFFGMREQIITRFKDTGKKASEMGMNISHKNTGSRSQSRMKKV